MTQKHLTVRGLRDVTDTLGVNDEERQAPVTIAYQRRNGDVLMMVATEAEYVWSPSQRPQLIIQVEQDDGSLWDGQ